MTLPRPRPQVLVIDGANVVGSRPNGWWRDRASAARRLHERLLVADTPYEQVILVLEGKAKAGVPAGVDAHVTTVHSPTDGDTAISTAVATQIAAGSVVIAVTADRALGARVEHLGARVMSPSWLLSLLED